MELPQGGLWRSKIYVFALLGFGFGDVKVRQQGRSPPEVCSMRTLTICTSWRHLQRLGALRRVVVASVFHATRSHVAVHSGLPECLAAEALRVVFFLEVFIPINVDAKEVI